MPAIPIGLEAFELRATTGHDVTDLQVELDLNGRRTVQAAVPIRDESVAARGPDGHLEQAAGTKQSNRKEWSATPEPLASGARLRYRFVAPGLRTRWYAVVAANWNPAGGQLEVNAPPGLEARAIGESVAWLVAEQGPVRVRFALRLEPAEHVVGFGERFDSVDQRGRALDVVVYEQYKAQGSRTYIPAPFAIVVGKDIWGFHVETSRRTWFDVGRRQGDAIWVEAAVDPRDPQLRIDLFAGSASEVLGQFLRRTGRPKLPPDWIFRPWMSGNEWNTQDRVMAEVERSRQEQIGVGVLVIEAWSDESTFVAFRDARYQPHHDGAPHELADFDFPSDGAWPDPKAMVDELHSRGIKVLLWQIPLLKARPTPGSQAAYDEQTMVSRNYAVRVAGGRPYRNRGWWFPRALMPDFTSNEARQWWLAKRGYLVNEVGVDGFKTDGGEHAWGDDLRYSDGTWGDAGNNRYPVIYAAAYHALLDSAGVDGITFSRAGFAGSASYPCHWAGDEASSWDAFRASITAGITAGASGIFFWGWDLAGFSGEVPDAELYLRAAGMACLCPIMQYHSEYNFHRRPSRDRTPWNIAERTQDPRVIPTYRRFANVRESLVPYLAEQSRRCVETSKPLMRGMFFEVLHDEEIWNWPLQYFLGDGLLVAPVTQPGVESWRVYLPEGEWIDAWSRQHVRGPLVLERQTSLDEVPVYVRAPYGDSLLPSFR